MQEKNNMDKPCKAVSENKDVTLYMGDRKKLTPNFPEGLAGKPYKQIKKLAGGCSSRKYHHSYQSLYFIPKEAF